MRPDEWTPPDLSEQVAVITGASRGIGRGIAEVLGSCGATVYVVARTGLDDVADAISSSGGTGVPAPTDLRDDSAIDALFERVRQERGRLDVLVNNAVAWADDGPDHDVDSKPWLMQPPWFAPRSWWDSNFDVGVRSHAVVTNAAASLFVAGRRGIVVFTSERQPELAGMQEFVMDLRATAVERMAFLYSLHFRPHGVSSILLYPGFSRTEAIEQSFERGDNYFEGWSKADFLQRTASTRYAGRAVAALAAEPSTIELTGQLLTSHDVATAHGFTDITGDQPDPV